MPKRICMLLKSVIFIVILVICIGIVERILIPKYLSDERWETTLTVTGFYQMKKNTVDVLCLGSSRAAASLNPQILYDEYGIRAYNLGLEQQNMVTSYFWLKEALRYQKPKAVLLHTYALYDTGRSSLVLNSQVPMIQKALDWMRWSPNKIEAIYTICRLAPELDAFDFIFPFMNFHSRWEELAEEDYDLSFMWDSLDLKGYEALRTCSGNTEFKPLDSSSDVEYEKRFPYMEEYLGKIIDLCKNEGIEIILYETPAKNHRISMNRFEAELAEDKGVLFLDYGEKSLYEETGYQFETDNADSIHSNVWGAEKITRHLGKILRDRYGVTGLEDAQWISASQAYHDIKKDCALPWITDIEEYLTAIRDDRYCLFLALKGDVSGNLDEDTVNALKALGMHCTFTEAFGNVSYYAVVSQGALIDEKMGAEKAVGRGSVRKNRTMYEITSGACHFGNTASILLDGKEYSMKRTGWNLVVYNAERNRVLDQVCLSTDEDGALTFNRAEISY